MKYLVLATIITTAFLTGCFGDSSAQEKKEDSSSAPASTVQDYEKLAASEAKANQLHPEDIIKFHQETFACASKQDLAEVIDHIARNEKTKAVGYFITKENPYGSCIMVDISKKYKVISVEYNDPDDQEIGIMEVVTPKIEGSKEGAWALTSGAWVDDK